MTKPKNVFPQKLGANVQPGYFVLIYRIQEETGWTQTEVVQYALKALDCYLEPRRQRDGSLRPFNEEQLDQFEGELKLT